MDIYSIEKESFLNEIRNITVHGVSTPINLILFCEKLPIESKYFFLGREGNSVYNLIKIFCCCFHYIQTFTKIFTPAQKHLPSEYSLFLGFGETHDE